MKSIIRKLKLIFFIITCIFLSNFSLAIDPVEIGFGQKNIEINLSILDNLNQVVNKEKFEIKKDIRTKIKKKENVSIKTENYIEKKLARINKRTESIISQIQIFFNSETANLKNEDINKVRNFINNQANKKNLRFKITSFAKTNKTEDISRRLSLDRAINVRSVIMKEGIPAKNLIVKSFGDA